MSTVLKPENGDGLAAANNQPAKTNALNTNDLDYPTGTRRYKAIAALSAELAIKGYAVHQLKDDGFLLCRHGDTLHASDFETLEAIALQLGVCK